MFGLGWLEIGALVVIALLVFGPEQLPRVAAQAGEQLRNLRRLANSARDDLRAGLGPEFSNFDPADLNPRHFVRKHLLDPIEDEPYRADAGPSFPVDPAEDELPYGERPPFDPEAT